MHLRRHAPTCLPLGLALVASGCLYVPVTSREQGFADQQTAELAAGETSRARVVEMFGEPVAAFEGGATWVYADQGQSARWLFLGFGQTPYALTERETEDHFLRIDFDASGTVAHWETAHAKHKQACSSSGICTGHGMSVLDSRAADARAKDFGTPPGGCAVYLYANAPWYIGDPQGDAVYVWLDGEPAGPLIDAGHFFRFARQPGAHTVATQYLVPRTDGWVLYGPHSVYERRFIEFSCIAGEKVFLRVDATSEPPHTLSRELQEEGRRAIRKRRLLLNDYIPVKAFMPVYERDQRLVD
jgi:hypothetical protein